MTPGRATYLWTYAALVILSGLTLGLSSLSLGSWGIAAALAIAAAKGLLIALFFMHLVEQRQTNALLFAAGLLLAMLLVGLSAADVATREVGAFALPEPPEAGS